MSLLLFIRIKSFGILSDLYKEFKMDQIQQWTEPCKQFVKDSIRLVKKCTKPDRKGSSTIEDKRVVLFN